MLSAQTKKRLSAACVVLWLLSIPAGATEAVLCIGPDGHVAIESPYAEDCDECTDGHENVAAEVTAGEECLNTCGNCLDIPLPAMSEAVTVSKSRTYAPVLAVVQTTSCDLNDDVVGDPDYRLAGHSTRPPNSILVTRLLC